MAAVRVRRAGDSAPLAIITGAGRGIGRATAEAFAVRRATHGDRRVACSFGTASGEEFAKAGRTAIFLHTDVTDPISVTRCVRSTLGRLGQVDCLVNNSGVVRVGTLAELPVREIDRMSGVNIRGPLLMSRAVLPR